MHRTWKLGLNAAMGLFVAGCGLTKKDQGSSDDNDRNVKGPKGCIQGAITDGMSGQALKLPASSKKAETGIFVLVRNQLLPAKPAISPNLKDKNGERPTKALDGEYTLCGVPLDETFPLFAWVDGYQPFQSEVRIDSRHLHIFRRGLDTDGRPSESYEGELEKRAMPTLLANIRLFKTGIETQTLEFLVSHDGQPLEGATVQLTPKSHALYQNKHIKSTANHYLMPSDERLKALQVVTDREGKARFDKTELVLGGVYDYLVLPANGGRYELVKSGQITVGLLTRADQQNGPFLVYVDLEPATATLAVIASSFDLNEFNERGEITYYFNRPVEIVPGTMDVIKASISGQVWSELVENEANNDRSEQVIVNISENRVTLLPKFKEDYLQFRSLEAGMAVTYSGLRLRPVGGPDTLAPWKLPTDNATVSFYGGETGPAPKVIEIVSGNDQSGHFNTTLSEPIVVRVLDQNGQPFENALVQFSVRGGQTSLVKPIAKDPDDDIDLDPKSRIETTTDSAGLAKVDWLLGTDRSNEIIAKVVNAPEGRIRTVAFSATGTEAP